MTFTFEGLPDVSPIGSLQGVQFGPLWESSIDLDAGGVGSWANEPSPSTVAALGRGPGGFSATRISFPQPVQDVSFLYSLAGAQHVYAYDSQGQLVGMTAMTQCGSTFCGAICVGDPDGEFCSWAPLQVAATEPIAYVEFDLSPMSGIFGMDDLTFNFAPPPQVPTLTPLGLLVLAASVAGTGMVWVRRRLVA